MSIPQIPLGFRTPAPADTRNMQGYLTSNVADALMDSGRAIKTTSNVQNLRLRDEFDFEDSGIMAAGDSVYVEWEIREFAPPPDVQFYAGIVQGDRGATWAFEGLTAVAAAAVGLAIDASGNLTTVIFDNATPQTNAQGSANFGISVAAASPAVKNRLGMQITLVSSTQIDVVPFKDGSPGTKVTLNNAAGVGNIRFQSFRAGCTVALPKGSACDQAIGNVFVSAATMPDADDQITYQLPNGMGATNQWFDHTGLAAAVNSEWNDAFGAISTTSFNTTGSVLVLEKANMTFPALAFPSDYKIVDVGMNVGASFNGTTFDASRVMAIDHGGTTVEKDITFGKAAMQQNGACMRFWSVRGDGAAWTPADVDADAWYVKQPIVAGVREYQAFAVGQMVWWRRPSLQPRRRGRLPDTDPPQAYSGKLRRPFLATAAAVVSGARRRVASWF